MVRLLAIRDSCESLASEDFPHIKVRIMRVKVATSLSKTVVSLMQTPTMNSEVVKPSNVILSIEETAVAVLELNRPHKRNALSQDLINELTGVLQHLDRDPTVRCVVLTSCAQSPFCGECRNSRFA